MTSTEVYREHRKILIRMRDRCLARFEAARDKRTVQTDLRQAEALTAAIEVLENEIASLQAIESRFYDRSIEGKH